MKITKKYYTHNSEKKKERKELEKKFNKKEDLKNLKILLIRMRPEHTEKRMCLDMNEALISKCLLSQN